MDIGNDASVLRGISLIFFAACELMPSALMHIFASDDELIKIGADYFRIAGFSYLITGISQCYLTTMKVTDHVKVCAIISSSAVVWHLPVLVVYACTCVDEVGKIPWVMIRLRKYKWVKNLTEK